MPASRSGHSQPPESVSEQREDLVKPATMPRPITLTYTLHPAHGPQRAYLLDALTGIQAQLPLRNLHWKSPTRTSIRTIQEVDVQLVELGEMGPQREVGASVMDGALVNLCLVACDVSWR